LILLATPAGLPRPNTTNGLQLQTHHNAPIDANSVSRAVTNRPAVYRFFTRRLAPTATAPEQIGRELGVLKVYEQVVS
jgi:hypothetical protein